MKKRKLLWVSQMIPYPPVAGHLIRSFHLIKHLSNYFDIELYALNQENALKPYFSSLEEGIEESRNKLTNYCSKVYIHDDTIRADKVTKIRNSIFSIFSFRPYSSLWMQKNSFLNILRTIDFDKYDVIHFDTLFLDFYLPKNLEDLNGMTVLCHHNAESHMMERRAKNSKNLFLKFFYLVEAWKIRKIERNNIDRFDFNIFCSNDDLERLSSLRKKTNFKVIPNGFEESKFSLRRKPGDQLNLLFVGTMDWYPNVSAVRKVLNFWPKLKALYPDATFDIVGANPPVDLIQDIKNYSGISIHGFVPSIDRFYEQCTAFISPINDGGGTKLKIIEVIANKIPLIAHPLACEGLELPMYNSVFFAEKDEEFIEQVAFIYENADKANCRAEVCYRHIRDKLSFSSISKEYFKLLTVK